MPIEEIGVAAGSGGALTVFLMKILPVLFRRVNGKGNGNGKPGTAKTCIEHVKKVAEHDTVIKHLCEISDKLATTAETARTENREDHKQLLSLLLEKRDAVRQGDKG